MQARTRKHHTKVIEKVVEKDILTADEVIADICGDMPKWAVYLRGLRYREDLTQVEMAELLKMPQGNISQMEHGKRPIGKMMAKKLAKLFNTDYRYFL